MHHDADTACQPRFRRVAQLLAWRLDPATDNCHVVRLALRLSRSISSVAMPRTFGSLKRFGKRNRSLLGLARKSPLTLTDANGRGHCLLVLFVTEYPLHCAIIVNESELELASPMNLVDDIGDGTQLNL